MPRFPADPVTKPTRYPESQCQTHEPRLIPCKMKRRPHHDADRGLNFFHQTQSHAIVLCNSVPADTKELRRENFIRKFKSCHSCSWHCVFGVPSHIDENTEQRALQIDLREETTRGD